MAGSVLSIRLGIRLVAGLTIAIVLSGCTPERRAVLRLTAMGFRDQATEAIEAIRGIYQLREPPRSVEETRGILVDRLLQSPLNVGDVRKVDQIIRRSSGEPAERKPTQVDLALNDLKAEYDQAAIVFRDIERLDLGSREAVAQAAKPARNLTIKMLLLAKLISEFPPTPGDPARVAISVKLDELRRKYASSKTSDAERQTIKTQVNRLIDDWLKVDAEERQIVCEALAKTVRAAETGQKLSRLIDEYGQRRLEDVLNEITQVLGTASTVTGRDYGAIATRLQGVNDAIQNDSTLKGVLQEILKQSSSNSWLSDSQLSSETPRLQCQP